MTPQERFFEVVQLYSKMRYREMLEKARQLSLEYPTAFEIWNVLAAAYKAIGNVSEAEYCFRKAVELNPAFSEASYNLGVVLQEQGKLDEAISAYRRAVEANPGNAVAYFNMGNAQRDGGQFSEALSSYSRAVAVAPEYAEAYNNIGSIHKNQGKTTDALDAFQKAIQIAPAFPEAHYNIGVVLYEQNKIAEAISVYRKLLTFAPEHSAARMAMVAALSEIGMHEDAILVCGEWIKILPDSADAHLSKGNALLQLGKYQNALESYMVAARLAPSRVDPLLCVGMALEKQSKLDEALQVYRNILKVDPKNIEALIRSGAVLVALERYDEAVSTYQSALLIKPNSAALWSNLGVALHQIGDFTGAVNSLSRSLELDSNYAAAYKNLGICLQDQGKLEHAISAFKRTLELEPNQADAYYGLGQTYLAKCDFVSGFKLCEWRWETGQIGQPLKSSKPKWEGQREKRVLLWSEQGLGDEIMFSSVILDLFPYCTRLIVCCDARLIPIFKRSFPSSVEFRPKGNLISEDEYDFQVSMGSAQGFFRRNLHDFNEAAKPFLRCDVSFSLKLRSDIASDSRRKLVGISWSTKSTKRASSLRNIDLKKLATSLQAADIVLVNLQYGDVSQELRRLKHTCGISIAEVAGIDNRTNIDGLSALISACDQVVSIDNVTVHLAGALGVDTRVLLPCNPDWRWGQKEMTSYWYRSISLYRQTAPGQWDEALLQLQKEIL